jgi:hypothetical protein
MSVSISRSRVKAAGWVVAGLALCLGGFWMIGDGGVNALLGTLCVLFFGAGIIPLARDAISPRPLVILDARCLKLPRQRIDVPWSEVIGATVQKVGSARFTRVEISNPMRRENERLHEWKDKWRNAPGLQRAIVALIGGVAVVSGQSDAKKYVDESLSTDFVSSPTRIDIATTGLPYTASQLADEIGRWAEAARAPEATKLGRM